MMEKKSESRIKKEETVKKLVEKLKSAKSIVLADHSGLNVAAFSDIKNQLEKDEAEFTVAKNTLLSLAAKKVGLSIPPAALKGPTAIVLSYGDDITPIKDFMSLAKQYEKPEPKAGFLGKELISIERIKQIALLPTKDELQAKVVWALISPIYGLVGVLDANIRNLVFAIDQIRAKKGD